MIKDFLVGLPFVAILVAIIVVAPIFISLDIIMWGCFGLALVTISSGIGMFVRDL